MGNCVMELEGFFNTGAMLKSGVYALVYRGAVVYVGKSKMMLGRIYNHRILWGRSKRSHREGVPWLPKGILFDDIWVRPCPLAELDVLEYQMINLYKPKNNTQLKNGLPVTLPPDIFNLVAGLMQGRVTTPQAAKQEGTIRRRV